MKRDPVHEAMKGVVRIYARGFNEGEVRSILDPRFVSPEEWVASGFFFRVKGDQGLILTNSHVVRNATELEIMSILTSDELFRVEVAGFVSSMEPDVGVLRLPPAELKRFLKIAKIKDLPYLRVCPAEHVSRGVQVKAIGYPLGMAEPNISGGEITNFIAGNDEMMEHLVTDAAINPGNSGGPAVTPEGKVIGINTSIAVPANNIGFITPIYLVDTVLDEILRRGVTTTSHLGAILQKNSEQNSHFFKMKKTEGVIVREVMPGSLADKMGLQARDVIITINGCRIDRHGNVQSETGFRKKNIYDILHSVHRSKPVTLKIIRKGRFRTLKSTQVDWELGYFPSQPIVLHRRFIQFCGLVVQELCDEVVSALSALVDFDELRAYEDFKRKGYRLIVTHIGSGTIAEEMGLSLGDLFVTVNGEPVQTLEHLQTALEAAQKNSQKNVLLEFSSGALASFDTQSLRSEDFRILHITTKLYQKASDKEKPLPAPKSRNAPKKI